MKTTALGKLTFFSRVLAWLGLSLATNSALALIADSSIQIEGDGADVALRMITSGTDAYVVGVTSSTDFPVTDGSTYSGDNSQGQIFGDLFVARIDQSTDDNRIVWLKYIGGSGSDVANGIDFDGTDTLTVSGWTNSSDFPVTGNARQPTIGGASDAIIIQLDPDGNITYASYYGGSGDDQFSDLVYLPTPDTWAFGGFSNSADFPFPENNPEGDETLAGSGTDGLVVTMLNDVDRTISIASFLGRSPDQQDIIFGVGKGFGNDFYVTGSTTDVAFYDNVSFKDDGKGGEEMFVTRFNTQTGRTSWSRLMSGSGDDIGFDVDGGSGTIIAVGQTTSTDFPILFPNQAIQSTFGGGNTDGIAVMFVNPNQGNTSDGRATYFGGSGDDSIRDVIIGPNFHQHFVGITSSTDLPTPINSSFPLTPGQPEYAGGASDGFVATVRFDASTVSNQNSFAYHRFTYAGSAGEDGFNAVAINPIDNPSGEPSFPQAFGFTNNPVVAASNGRKFSKNASANSQREAVRGERFSQGSELLFGADLEAGPILADQMFTQNVFVDEPFFVEFTIVNNGPDANGETRITIALHPDIDVQQVLLDGTEINNVNFQEEPDGSAKTATISGPSLNPRNTVTVGLLLHLLQLPSDGLPFVQYQATNDTFTPDPNPQNNSARREWTARERSSDFFVDLADSFSIDPNSDETVTFSIGNGGPDDANGPITGEISLRIPNPNEPIGVSEIQSPTSDSGKFSVTETRAEEDGALLVFDYTIEALDLNEMVTVSVPLRIFQPLQISARISSTPGMDPNQDNNQVIDSAINFTAGTGLATATFFNDIDGDGVQDMGENPLSNYSFVLVVSQDGQDDQFFELSTDGNGQFVSPALPAGATVEFRPTEAANETIRNSMPNNSPIANNASVNFGSFGVSTSEPGSISGTLRLDDGSPLTEGTDVFIDVDADGILSPVDILAVVITNVYTFSDLEPGTYDVVAVTPSDYEPLNPPAFDRVNPFITVQVKPGENVMGVDFTFLVIADIRLGTGITQTGLILNEPLNLEFEVTNPSDNTVRNVSGTVGSPSGTGFSIDNFGSSPDYTFQSLSPTEASFEIPEIGPGETISLSAELVAFEIGQFILNFAVSGDFSDPDSGNNGAGLSFNVIDRAVTAELDWSHWIPVGSEHELEPVIIDGLELVTYDGNVAVLQVTVENLLDVEVDIDVKLRQLKGMPLKEEDVPDGFETDSFSAKLKPNFSEVFNFRWNTNTEAWDGFKEALPFFFNVKITEKNGVFDEIVLPTTLTVRPRPVVGVHGLWSSFEAWADYDALLRTANEDWSFFAIGDGAKTGTLQTGELGLGSDTNLTANAEALANYVNQVREDLGADYVDLVAHSMGGLISRLFIQELVSQSFTEEASVRNLVMLGTPNEGTACVDILLPILMKAASVNPNLDVPVNLLELKTDFVTKIFNSRVTDNQAVAFHAVGADAELFPGFANVLCLAAPNDGLVSVPSALAENTPTLLLENFLINEISHRKMTENSVVFTSFVGPVLADAPPVASGDQTTPKTPGALQELLAGLPVSIVGGEVLSIPASSAVTAEIKRDTSIALAVLVADSTEISVTLRDPSGTIVEAEPVPAGDWDSFFQTLIDTTPSVGTYELEIVNNTEGDLLIPFSALEFESATTLETTVYSRGNSGEVLVEAEFAPKDSGSLSASNVVGLMSEPGTAFTAHLADQNGNLQTITLQDDGANGDAVALDGIFSGKFVDLGIGSYAIGVEGIQPDGLVRYKSVALNFFDELRLDIEALPTGNLRLFWPVSFTDAFVLESNSDLTPEGWTPVPETPTESDGVFEVVLTPDDLKNFYRLRLLDQPILTF